MNPEPIVSFRNKWFACSVGLAVGIAIVSIAVGFVWLPSQQAGGRLLGVWYSICSAAGLIRVPPIHEQVVQPAFVTAPVDVVPNMLRHASAGVRRMNPVLDVKRPLDKDGKRHSLQLAYLLNAMKQNDVMKRLAAWAAMLAVPTAITGVYGMNFENIPELNWQYGFYSTMVLIAIICAFLYWRFHKSGWL